MYISKIQSSLLAPFKYFDGVNKRAILLFVLINSIVLFNVISHSPKGNYDLDSHMDLVLALSEGRIPDENDGRDYHSPYLPYLIPAATYRVATEFQFDQIFTLNENQGNVYARSIYYNFLNWHEDTNYALAAKAGQFQMFFVSIGITYLLAILSKKIMPEKPSLQLVSLATLGFLPVYYRSLSMLRGEPFLALFMLSALLFTINVYIEKNASPRNILLAGASIGLAVLSRHLGVILGPMIALYALLLVILKRVDLQYYLKTIFPIGLIAMILASTFFGPYLYRNNYKFLPQSSAFINYPDDFSLSNVSTDYFTDLALDKLFIDPVRPEFSNAFFPMLYSDTFGDYWGYFLVSGKDLGTGQFLGASTIDGYYYDFLFLEKTFPPERFNWETNRIYMGAYLGVVNVLSLPVFLLFIYGFILSLQSFFKMILKRSQAELSHPILITLLLLGNFLLFIYLTIRYGGSEMAKATYIFHLFPLLSILSGYAFMHIKKKNESASNMLMCAFIIIALIKIPTYFTHWIQW